MELAILTQENVVINILVYDTEDEKNNIISSIPSKFKVLARNNVPILSKYDEQHDDFIPTPPYSFFVFDSTSREWNPDSALEYNLYDQENESFVNLDTVSLENTYLSGFSISLYESPNPKYTWSSSENNFILVP